MKLVRAGLLLLPLPVVFWGFLFGVAYLTNVYRANTDVFLWPVVIALFAIYPLIVYRYTLYEKPSWIEILKLAILGVVVWGLWLMGLAAGFWSIVMVWGE